MMMFQSRLIGRRWVGLALAVVVVIASPSWLTAQSEGEDLGDIESAFAATMADRDLEGFASFLDPEGNRIGTFNSIWRLNADGVWKIVFDRGCP